MMTSKRTRPAIWGRWIGLATLALLAAGAGCSRAAGGAAAAAPTEKRYPLHGEILSVNAQAKTLTIAHEAIPGLMPAMTMEYAAGDGDLAIARVGERIKAQLVEDHGNYHLEDIWRDDRAATDTVAEAANELRQDTAARGRGAYREIGEAMPDFALFDQDGRVVQAARFRGRQIMLNFIYTRCPIATMCPAATLRMMEVQKQARAAGVTNLQLISISLDPSYDTPGVLKEYAQARGIDTGNFAFLTGPERAIRDLLTQFGVIAEFKDGLLKHSLATLLINEQGRIIHRADGSEWTANEFVERMHKG
ncbi:MAG TPA: SCO family protein [Opitutaceae bacterium]|nr:SCO family protein [Opitutaceae bacterium]